ncbi:MAG: tyrosine-type recombinase/integrase [Planctomycetes bacterium]|nr:tyrosine-type recombinase/integrase [Planctomycetota bacterium]
MLYVFKSRDARTLQVSNVDDYLLTWLEAFLIDRKAAGVAEGTLRFYRQKIKLFSDYCDALAVKQIGQINPPFLRQYLLYLEEYGHNAGGRHAAFRSLRAFLNWYEAETEPEGWVNPIHKVKTPKVPIEPLEPVSHETIASMVKTCNRGSFTGDRDAAILLCLLDTGARASEFLNIDLEDLNQASGTILIRHGKGSKPREVYLGRHSKQILRKYLKYRSDDSLALWVTHPRFSSERLGYDGLRAIIHRRSVEAKVEEPSLHDFRRAFALAMLRNGTDVYTLAKLMGHEGITVLQRYLKQTYQDTEAAHRRAGQVDNCQFLAFL